MDPFNTQESYFMPPTGIEPATFGLQGRCSTNWATVAMLCPTVVSSSLAVIHSFFCAGRVYDDTHDRLGIASPIFVGSQWRLHILCLSLCPGSAYSSRLSLYRLQGFRRSFIRAGHCRARDPGHKGFGIFILRLVIWNMRTFSWSARRYISYT